MTVNPGSAHVEIAGRVALWSSLRDRPPPGHIERVDDRLTADAAYRLASQGTALLWTGDYHNARQLLQALTRRIAKRRVHLPTDPAAAFHANRQMQAQRANILSMLVVPLSQGKIPLPRAPDLADALQQLPGLTEGERLIPLRDLLSLVSAYEWKRNGVPLPALAGFGDGRIHPHFDVFPPTRPDYLQLVAAAPLPAALARDSRAMDIGTGSGVLAAILAARGIERIIATDTSPAALACAADNFGRLGLSERIELHNADLFPDGRAPLIVCNPPWLPGKAAAPLEAAVYDPESRMLRGFLAGVKDHLGPDGEAWLIVSDLAEHLRLRSRAELLDWIAGGGLVVRDRHDIQPTHSRARDPDDALHFARSAEITSLWRLAVQP